MDEWCPQSLSAAVMCVLSRLRISPAPVTAICPHRSAQALDKPHFLPLVFVFQAVSDTILLIFCAAYHFRSLSPRRATWAFTWTTKRLFGSIPARTFSSVGMRTTGTQSCGSRTQSVTMLISPPHSPNWTARKVSTHFWKALSIAQAPRTQSKLSSLRLY